MKLRAHNPPHIRSKETSKTVMDDILLVLIALYLMASYYYGPRAAVLGLWSAAIAILCDIICKKLLGHKINVREHSSIVTALIIPLLLPATVDYTIVAAAVLFALLVVKFPFGGVGHNLFNPAAGGFAFVAICFPAQVFSYPMPLEKIEIFEKFTGNFVYSAAYTLKAGGVPSLGGLLEMLLGNMPGPMGATNVLVVLTCLVYLAVRGTVRLLTPVCFMASCAVQAWIFPRAPIEPLSSVMYELCSGALIFGAVFMITEPVTSPKRAGAQAVYAVFAGVITMLFRRFGVFEEPLAFALLFCNALVPSFDYFYELLMRRVRRCGIVSIQNKKA